MTRRRRCRALLDAHESDPLLAVANLFDVAMVFAVALLVAFAAARTGAEVDPEHEALDRFVETGTRRAGDGERLGTAYRLADGRIVYVPE